MATNRYSKILEKNKREIVLLRGKGCSWKKCKFCDYHLDSSIDTIKNYEINSEILKNVTGEFFWLEVINSGSFVELDENTINLIVKVLIEKNIKDLTVELYFKDRFKIDEIKSKFKNVPNLKIHFKTGIESFDFQTRETLFNKGIGDINIEEVSKYFEQVCLLFGIKGQSIEVFEKDIEIAKKYFKRVCINIFTENSTKMKQDNDLIQWFIINKYENLILDKNIDILLENTDFGVGD